MRSYPQPEFSLAKRTMSASTSGAIGGRPGEARCLEPSNLRAMRRRYQARIVSDFGYAAHRRERAAAEPPADLSEGRSFGIGQAHTCGEARSQDAVFSNEVF